MKRANWILCLFVMCVSMSQIFAQRKTATTPTVTAIRSTTTDIGTVHHGSTLEPPRAIEFKEGAVSSAQFDANIRTYFNIPADYSFTETESSTDQLGIRHRYLQQYYKGVVIEGMGYRVHEKNGFVKSANGRSTRNIRLDLQTRLGEKQALSIATDYLKTKDTTIRAGKKLITSKEFTYTPESFALAFQFDMDVSLIEQWRISIDARTGEVINKVSLVNSCFHENEKEVPPLPYTTGTGLTRYYGQKNIRIEKFDDGSARLVGQTENGGMLQTYTYNNASVLAWFFGFNVPLYNISSSTTNFIEPYHKSAVSVQWAAEQAYEYYFKKLNRRSFDNNNSTIEMLVNVDVGMNNAFWSRNTLLFGDGSDNNPLVELDVVSHELTHGVTQFEASLQYYNESGALNESFSDIFAKAIEFDTFGDTATWQLAKYYRAGGLRDFSNPNLKNQPDTWLGDMWYTGYDDNGGVHYNSGVQNFWYYLLCEGGSGINDNEESYSVQSIGMDAATKITYRNLTEYLTYSSEYLDSRIGSLLAAADLYGKNSVIYQQVVNAWDAVGVIDEPIITNLELFDITATTVKLKGSLVPRADSASYHFEYGTTSAYGSSSDSKKYVDKVEGLLRGLKSETRYFLRLVATNVNGSSYAMQEFTTLPLTPMVRIKQTADITETSAILYGQINPNSLITSYYFEYGLTPSFGMITPTQLTSDTTEFIDVSIPVDNLLPRQTYYYRLVATNSSSQAKSTGASFFTSSKPIITSIAPIVGKIGDEVTIVGSNFNSIAEKNIVKFGATRATIVSASTTQLKVKVPVGASYGSLTVLDEQSGLMAQSSEEFVPTFSGGFDKGDLQMRVGINDIRIYQAFIEDMDGDGKPDIFASHNNSFSVYQNVNQGGDITAESFVRTAFNVPFRSRLWLADVDGNGLKDVVGLGEGGIRILPNLSVPGFVFFGAPVDIPSPYFYNLKIEDFDQDGRTDIALFFSYTTGTYIHIFRNKNPKGFILPENFTNVLTLVDASYSRAFETGDVNNDGKPDIILTAESNSFGYIFKNTSNQPGNLQFEQMAFDDGLKTIILKCYIRDLNQDKRKDIIARYWNTPTSLGLIENLSISPLTMGSTILHETDVQDNLRDLREFQFGDINGDGKVDMLLGLSNRTFQYLKNNLSPNDHFTSTSFEKINSYGKSIGDNNTVEPLLSINDLNGDGRPEVIAAYSYNYGPHDGYQMEIWQNAPPNCPDPSLIKVQVSDNTATIILPPNQTFNDYSFEYMVKGYDNWYPVYSTTLDLYRAASYQLRVRARCYLDYTNYFYLNFNSECVYLSTFSISNIKANSIDVYASEVNSFEIQYSPADKNQWLDVPTSNSYSSTQITNLAAGTAYDIRFRGRCNYPTEFNYRKVTTLCPTLTSITITNIQFNSAKVNWTSNYSGTVVLEYSPNNYNWISIGENQMMSPLLPAREYNVRGKLSCPDRPSDFIYTYFATPCPKVSNISVEEITPFSALVKWQDEANMGNYQVNYSPTTGGIGTSVQTTSTSIQLNKLTPGTNYLVLITPICSGGGNTTPTSFTTICFTPTNLATTQVSHNSADLSWFDSFGGVLYSVDYAPAGTNNWRTIQSSTTYVTLDPLRPATQYEARVHITCKSVTPQFTKLLFETNAYEETSLAPNPTDKTITIYPAKNLIGSSFTIYDNFGRQFISGKLLDYTFDLSLLAPGLYTLQIEGEKPIKILKR